MNIEDDITELFQKFIDNSCNQEERDRFYSYLKHPVAAQKINQLLDELRDYAGYTFDPQSELEEVHRILGTKNRSFDELIHKIKGYKAKAIEEKAKKKNKGRAPANKKSGWFNWFKRLFIITLVAAGAATWYHFSHQNSATATEVAYVIKVSEYGQKSTIPLPDGSLVKLNSGSKLVYPRLFEGNTREVSLQGEAFFEIARDENRPFQIKSGDLITTVLGTTFNIRAYPDEQQIEVAVATGKVKVQKAGKEGVEVPGDPEKPVPDAHLLTANMLASYSQADSKIKVESRENIEDLIAWREGVLKFSGLPFSEVAKTLEKWYGVKVVLENQEVSNCVIFGEFKNESLKRVMQTLRYAIDIEYELTTDGLFVGGKGCHAPN